VLSRLRTFITTCRAALPERPSPEDRHASELDRLETRLRDEKRKTEALARISYAKWKLRHQQEKEYAIRYGVTVPATTAQREQDQFFTALERRLDDEQQRYVEQTKALEFKDGEADRIERQRQATERVVRVLEEDLG
jgi:hypothetical protein